MSRSDPATQGPPQPVDGTTAGDEWATVPRLLAEQQYLVLGTADRGGRPWVTPLFFAAHGSDRLLWVSTATSRHSLNLAERSEVAITVFAADAPIGRAEALYLTADAAPVPDAGTAESLAVLNAKLPRRQRLAGDDLAPRGALRLYAATVTRHEVLIRGGDARYTNELDARLPVHPHGAPITRTADTPPG
jgi:hypothetical protein